MFPSSQSVSVITVSMKRFERQCHSCLTGKKAEGKERKTVLLFESHILCIMIVLALVDARPSCLIQTSISSLVSSTDTTVKSLTNCHL